MTLQLDAYFGEIRMFGGDYAPQDWALCNGQLLQISQYDALYALIGTTYGGDGVTTFALPDLRGRIPLGRGNGYSLGQKVGQEMVALSAQQVATHTHAVMASGDSGTDKSPAGNYWAACPANQFLAGPGTAVMSSAAITPSGGGAEHDNMMPYLPITFIICLNGYWPAPD